MKKLILLALSLFVFTACEKKFDGIVEASDGENSLARIVAVEVPDSVALPESGTTLSVTAIVEYGESSPEVYAYLKREGSVSASTNLHAVNSQNPATYQGEFLIGGNFLRGGYSVNFYVNGKFAASSFVYILGVNHPPVISDLNMPDSASIGESFVFSVFVEDEDGAGDIAGAYYNVYDPGGNLITNSQGVSDFPLSDNGDTNVSGDEVADDQIYTMKLAFPQGSQTGAWRFEFFAIDRAKEKSNVIVHNITVTQ